MIDYEKFTARFYPAANSSRKDDIKRFLSHLEELADGKEIKTFFQDKKQVCSLFFLQKNGGNVSRPHYQKVKEYLLRIYEFLQVDGYIPTREEVLSSQERICYFRSIDSLLRFIDNVGRDVLSTYNPTADLIRVKAICVLGWLGLSALEIAEIKANDLTLISNNGYKIQTPKGEFEIYGEAFASLYFLGGLDEYNSLPSGKKMYLTGSREYLFRSSTYGEEHLNDVAIIQVLKRFNAIVPPYIGKAIVFRNLYKNRVFLDIYNDKGEENLIAKIIKHIQCTQNYALSYRNQYIEFVNALENNKI